MSSELLFEFLAFRNYRDVIFHRIIYIARRVAESLFAFFDLDENDTYENWLNAMEDQQILFCYRNLLEDTKNRHNQ